MILTLLPHLRVDTTNNHQVWVLHEPQGHGEQVDEDTICKDMIPSPSRRFLELSEYRDLRKMNILKVTLNMRDGKGLVRPECAQGDI